MRPLNTANLQAANDVDAAVARVRQTYGRWGRGTTPAQMRADWDQLFGGMAIDAAVQAADLGGVPGEWVTAPGAQDGGVLLYLHGGGFQIGSPRSHRELTAALSAASGCRVFGLDYRLAPEHRHPAALEDALAAWKALLAQGERPQRMAVAGDSAGGGLALALLLALRDAGLPLPAAAVTMSAWTDLSLGGASYEAQAVIDPINQRATLALMARTALGPQGDVRDSRASPLLGDLHGLPALLMQVGEREIVLSDSTDFAGKAQAAGVEVTLQVWPGMFHVFQQFPAELIAARQARAAIGAFLRERLASPSSKKGS